MIPVGHSLSWVAQWVRAFKNNNKNHACAILFCLRDSNGAGDLSLTPILAAPTSAPLCELHPKYCPIPRARDATSAELATDFGGKVVGGNADTSHNVRYVHLHRYLYSWQLLLLYHLLLLPLYCFLPLLIPALMPSVCTNTYTLNLLTQPPSVFEPITLAIDGTQLSKVYRGYKGYKGCKGVLQVIWALGQNKQWGY